MKSRLYHGGVWHSRGKPAYRFQYRVWYLCLDLDEVEAVASKLRLLSHNRHNVASFWDRDYLALSASSSAPGESPGTGADSNSTAGRTTTELVTVPRILGHAFNPVSFLFQRQDGAITNVLAEVHNTWGERHVYTLAKREAEDSYKSGAAKAFYVSPFLPMEGGYRFELREDSEECLHVKIDLEDDGGESLFSAGIEVRPLTLSDTNLARMLLAYPFVNLKTIAMIHWQGARLWLRGARVHSKQKRPAIAERKLGWPKGH